jgi:large subunit ribosomal protein L25
MLQLQITERKAGGLGALRRTGAVPAVIYGAHTDSTSVVVDARAFEKALREAGEATVISLMGLKETIPALIHEVDVDPVTGHVRHIDFYAVTKGEKVEIEIPLEFTGSSPAVERGANLVKVTHELEVKADPMQLPQSIVVDLARLVEIDDRICAEDIALPKGVELVSDPKEVIALVQEVKEEVVTAAPADISSIEVEKKGKEESTEAEG